jgi:hypothetical protein
MRRKLIILTGLLGLTLSLYSQYNLDSAKARLYRINKVFDNARYLGFDVQFVYSTDTIYGKFNYEEMDGSYILSDNNMYYKMGSTEFMQNDSFVFNIDHDDKLMLMARQQVPSKGDLFPLKEFLDSTLVAYDTAFVINLQETSEYSKLSFTAKFDSLPYRYFAIYYDSSSYYPSKYEMEFYDGGDESDTVFLVSDSIQMNPYTTPRVKRRIAINFLNYYSPNSLAVFDNTAYIYFNRQEKVYEPAEKLKAYRLITNGVEREDALRNTETYVPSGNQE